MRRSVGWLLLTTWMVLGCDETGSAAGDGGPAPAAPRDGATGLDQGTDGATPVDGARVPDAGDAAADGAVPSDAATDGAIPSDAAPPGDGAVPADGGPDAAPCVPAPEICDGEDQDCDGAVDEALGTQPCADAQGACAAAMAQCVDGAWRCDRRPAQERCDGMVDEDCDGAVDEGCACAAGARRACGDDTGACQAGEQACVETCAADGCSSAWGPCVGEVGPEAERCDGRDEDCDGVIDEALEQACGLAEGPCVPGISRCEAGEWGACEGAVDPVQERCNGEDDDCDGAVDEGALLADVALADVGLGEVSLRARIFALGGAIAVIWTQDSPNTLDDDILLARFDWDGLLLAAPHAVGRLSPGANFRVLPTGDGALLLVDEKAFGQPDAPVPCDPERPHLFALDAEGQVVEALDCGLWLSSRGADSPLVSARGTAGALVGRDRHSLVAVRGLRSHVGYRGVGGAAQVWARWLRPGAPLLSERPLDGALQCATDDQPACGTPAVATTPGGLAVAIRDAEVIRLSRADLAGNRLADAVEVPADGVPVAVDLGDTAWVLWGTDQLHRAQIDADGVAVADPVDVAVGQLIAATYDGRRVTVFGRREAGVWSATLDRAGALVAPARRVFDEVDPDRYVGQGVRAWLGELGVATQRNRRAWLVTDGGEWRLQIDGVTPCSALPACGDEPDRCDGVDDDCDGLVDEAAALAPGECLSASPGACATGDARCHACARAAPAPEVACDGVDDDCDGTVHDLHTVTDARVCLDKDVLVCGDPRYQNFCGGRERLACQRALETLPLPDDQRLVLAHSEINLGAWALTAELDGQPDTRRLVTVRHHRNGYPEGYRVSGIAGGALWVAALTPESTGLLSPRALSFDLIRVPIEPDGLGAPIATPLPTGDRPSDGFIGQWDADPTLAVGDAHVALAWVRPDVEDRPGSVWLGVWDHAGEPVAAAREVVLDAERAVRAPRLVAVPGGFLLLAAVRIATLPDRRGDVVDDGYRIRAWPLSPQGELGPPQLVAELRFLATWDYRSERYRAPAAVRFDAARGAEGVLVAWGADAVDGPVAGVQTAFAGFDGRVAAPRIDVRPVAGDLSDRGLRVRATADGFLVLHAPGEIDAYSPGGQRLARVAVVEPWADGNTPLDLSVDASHLWLATRSVQSEEPARARLTRCE